MAYNYKGDEFWITKEKAINFALIVSTKLDPMLGAPNNFEDALHLEKEKMLLDKEEWFRAVIIPVDKTNSHICINLYDSGAI